VRSAGTLNSSSQPAMKTVSNIQASHSQPRPRRKASRTKMASTDRATTPKKKANAASGPAAAETSGLSNRASRTGSRKRKPRSASRRLRPWPAPRNETSSTSVNENSPTARPISGPRLPDQ
jgi:hypothetical protein